jgi:hypothetical protein
MINQRKPSFSSGRWKVFFGLVGVQRSPGCSGFCCGGEVGCYS